MLQTVALCFGVLLNHCNASSLQLELGYCLFTTLFVIGIAWVSFALCFILRYLA